MKGRRYLFAAMLLGVNLIASSAADAVPVTFVSGTGTDSGTCTAAAPCRSLQFAHDTTDARGTIHILASAILAGVKITKAISITANGNVAVIQTPSADCPSNARVCILAGVSDTVRLRGLTLDGRGSGGTGIAFVSGSALHVEQSRIIHWGTIGTGILFTPSASAALIVTDTLVTQGANGMDIRSASSKTTTVTIDRTQVENATNFGISFGNGTISGIIRDSVLSGHNSALRAFGTGIDILVEQSALANNRTPPEIGNALIRFSRSTVSGTVLSGGELGGIVYPTTKVMGNGEDPNASARPR